MDIIAIINNKRKILKSLDFSRKNQLKLNLSQKLNKGDKIAFGSALFDFQKNPISQKSKKDFISYLPLIGETILVEKDSKEIEIDFKNQRIILG